MKSLSAALLLAGLVYAIEAVNLPDPSWAVEVKPVSNGRVQLKLLGDDPTPDPAACNSKIFSCSSCRESRVCRFQQDNSIIPYATAKCPDERPYCDPNSGSCVATAPLSCGDDADQFVCLEKEHYFPDDDCHQFHYCDENYKARLFKCIGDGMVYNADLNQCIQSNECGKFDCSNNALKKMSHSHFSRYFAMCKSEANADGPLVVGVCPPYYQVDPKSQMCQPDCVAHGNGNIPDSKDCRKYWSCAETLLPTGETYMSRTQKSCPTDNSFDTKLFMCVPDLDGKICPKA